MSSRVFEMVDEMPFSGKFAVRANIKDYIDANESKEQSRFLSAQIFLLGMVAAHAYQAYMGYEALDVHLDSAVANEASPLLYLASSVDTLYITANSLVAARQASLMHRLVEIRGKKRKRWQTKQPEATLPDEENTPPKPAEKHTSPSIEMRKKMRNAAILTLAGQAIFLGSYSHAQVEENKITCAESTSQFYEEFVAAHPNEQFVSEAEYVDDICTG